LSSPARAEPGPFGGADAVVAAAVGRAFPGAVLAVGRDGRLAHLRAFGRLSDEAGADAVRPDTIYDLASLTKVVVTTSVAMTLLDAGALDLDAPVSALVPVFRGGGRDRVRLRQLLAHAGGVRWWAPLYRDTTGKAAYLERIAAMALDYDPGTRSVYSDLGFILLGEALERAGGASLEALARDRVLGPLGMNDSGYRPAEEVRPRVAPTGHDPWRGRLLRGEVHDENAAALGGVAPHAGLFGTAGDLARFAEALLGGGALEGRRFASPATVAFFTRRAGVPGSSRALGWDTADDGSGRRGSTPGQAGYSSAGSLLSPRSFGHTGFTGTSLWADPERGAFAILLSNRVHPTRENDAIRAVRSQVADAVARALGGRA
jgi:CubicO group peptidase (beta-lactamase class C family)